MSKFTSVCYRVFAAAVCVGGLSVPTVPLRADTADTPADQPEAVGEIIVTAQKRSERINDVPMSISAVTGAELQKLDITSAADLSKVVSGFTYEPSAYGSPIYSIRGIGFFDEAIGIAPTVSVYVDQVPLPFSRMSEGAALDVERIEVLKGPQGTLFGQNSTGGAINYIAAKPTDELHFGGSATYGRFSESDLDGYISGPVVDTVTARLSFRTENRGAWQESQSRDDVNGARDFATARLLVDWHPSDRLSFELNVNGWRDQSDTEAPSFYGYSPNTPTSLDTPGGTGTLGNPAQNPNLVVQLKSWPRAPANDRIADWNPALTLRRHDTFLQEALRGDLKLTDDITLTSISSYSSLGVASPSDDSGVGFLNGYVDVHGKIHTLAQELRLAGSFGENDKARWMLGANYQHDNIDDVQFIEFNSTNSFVGPFGSLGVFRYPVIQNISKQTVSTPSGFASIDYQLPANLTAQASGRYSESYRVFDGCLADVGDGAFGTAFGTLSNALHGISAVPTPGSPSYVPPGGCVTFNSQNYPDANVHKSSNEKNTSWRVGLSWKASSETMLYGNVTRGYKEGNFGTLPILSDSQVSQVYPEELTAYEVGFKASAFDRRLDISGATFYYDYKNKQLLGYVEEGPPFGNLPAETTIPKSRVIGAELTVGLRPVTGWTVNLGGSYINSKVKEHYLATSPIAEAPQEDVIGQRFPNTPVWTFNGDTEYAFPLRSEVQGFVGGTVTFRSATFDAFAAPQSNTAGLPAWGNPGSFNLPSYALLDLRAGIQGADGKWRLQVWGHNVTNKYYWLHVARIFDTVNRLNGMPATYGVTLSARF